MFKKSKRNIARRIRVSDSDEEEKQVDSGDTRITAPIKDLPLASNAGDSGDDFVETSCSKPNTILSFNDQDDNDVFVVKKTNHSRRMEKRKKKMLLQSDSSDKMEVDVQLGRKLDHYRQTPQQAINDYEDVQIVCPVDDDEDDDVVQLPTFGLKTNNKSEEIHEFRTALSRGVIPDLSVINRLKQQRQKAAQAEYIALADDDEDEALREAEKMRLFDQKFDHSDGSDLDEDQTQKRVLLGKIDYRTMERQRAKEAIHEAQLDFAAKKIHDESSDEMEEDEEQEEEDSENEVDRWEREQMEKAMKMKSIRKIEKNHKNLSKLFSKNPTRDSGKTDRTATKSSRTAVKVEESRKKTIITPNLPSHITKALENMDLDDFNNRRAPLRAQLAMELEDNRRLLDRTRLDLKVTKESVNCFEKRKADLVDDYNLYKSVREYVRSLCDCISDKFQALEEVEKEIFEIYNTESMKQMQHSRQLVRDYHSVTATFFVQRDQFRAQFQHVSGETIFDYFDFGGDLERRNRVWLSEQLGQRYFLDEFTLDQTNRETVKNSLKKLANIFEDTTEEFSTIAGVLNEFRCWRDKHPETYLEAFVPDFLGKFVEFHVRIAYAGWNPIDADQMFETDFLKLPSIVELIEYSSAEVDAELIPILVEKFILKTVDKYLDLWNPFSVLQTERISSLIHSLVVNIPSLVDSPKSILPSVLQKILLKFEATFDSEIVMPMIAPNVDSTSSSIYDQVIQRFSTKQFSNHVRRVLNLWRNILSFDGLIQSSILVDMVRDKLARRHVFITLAHKSLSGEHLLEYLDELFQTLPHTWKENGSAASFVLPWIAMMVKNHSTNEQILCCLSRYQAQLESSEK